jgi:transcriptional regulator with XRE-family HTH domain
MRAKSSDIVSRIDVELKRIGGKRAGLCRSVGVSSGSLSDWIRNGTIPDADIALKIAEYLGVSIHWLITGKDEQGLTLEERNLLAKYSRLDVRDRYEINALLDAKLAGSVPGQKEASDPQRA